MGASNTNLSKNLASNEYIMKLVGTEHISSNDPFWNQFLSFSSTIPKNMFVFFLNLIFSDMNFVIFT